METRHPVVTDVQTLEEVTSCPERNIPADTRGNCDRRTVYEIPIRAAGRGDSTGNICGTPDDVPCGSDIGYHPEKSDDIKNPEIQLDKALHDRIPPRIYKGKLHAAAGLNLIPYYGTPVPAEVPYIYRSDAESGACPFYAYAAVYVIKKNKRAAVALTSVRADDTDAAVITRLSDKISPLNIGIKRLCPDRGFFSVPVIRRLKAPGIPSAIPAVVRGKNGGTRQLAKGGKSCRRACTMIGQKYGTVTFGARTVSVYKNWGSGKHGIEYSAYAVRKITLKPRGIHDDYRKRSGTETGYRMKNGCRTRTACKNPPVRLLYTGTAFIPTDIRVYLSRTYISFPGKGGREVFHELFPLKPMPTFLRQAADLRHRVINSVYLK